MSITLLSTTTTSTTILRPPGLCLGLPWWAGTRKVQPEGETNPDLLEQEIVSGGDISWAICKSALRPRQITTPASRHSVFYRLDAFPAAEPTASKHWRWTSQNTEIWSQLDIRPIFKIIMMTECIGDYNNNCIQTLHVICRFDSSATFNISWTVVG